MYSRLDLAVKKYPGEVGARCIDIVTFIHTGCSNTNAFSINVRLHQRSAFRPFPFAIVPDALVENTREKEDLWIVCRSGVVVESESELENLG